MNSMQLPAEKKNFGKLANQMGKVFSTDKQSAGQQRQTLEYLAWLLDESIEIPGLKFKIGLDSLIGLIPGVGDLVSAGLSTYIVASAARLGVPKTVVAQMTLNSVIDTVIGMVPLVGDVFDATFKANKRNLGLIMDSLDNPRRGKKKALKSFFWTSLAIGGLVVLPAVLLVAGAIALFV